MFYAFLPNFRFSGTSLGLVSGSQDPQRSLLPPGGLEGDAVGTGGAWRVLHTAAPPLGGSRAPAAPEPGGCSPPHLSLLPPSPGPGRRADLGNRTPRPGHGAWSLGRGPAGLEGEGLGAAPGGPLPCAPTSCWTPPHHLCQGAGGPRGPPRAAAGCSCPGRDGRPCGPLRGHQVRPAAEPRVGRRVQPRRGSRRSRPAHDTCLP